VSFSELISPLLGRLALAWFFLSAAFKMGGDWDTQVDLLTMAHLPAPPVLLALSLIVMVLGGLSLLLGFHARHGAVLLFVFTVLVTMLLEDYWHIANAVERAQHYQIFARNVAIAGGLLMIVGMGAGPFALDNRAGQKKKR